MTVAPTAMSRPSLPTRAPSQAVYGSGSILIDRKSSAGSHATTSNAIPPLSSTQVAVRETFADDARSSASKTQTASSAEGDGDILQIQQSDSRLLKECPNASRLQMDAPTPRIPRSSLSNLQSAAEEGFADLFGGEAMLNLRPGTTRVCVEQTNPKYCNDALYRHSLENSGSNSQVRPLDKNSTKLRHAIEREHQPDLAGPADDVVCTKPAAVVAREYSASPFAMHGTTKGDSATRSTHRKGDISEARELRDAIEVSKTTLSVPKRNCASEDEDVTEIESAPIAKPEVLPEGFLCKLHTVGVLEVSRNGNDEAEFELQAAVEASVETEKMKRLFSSAGCPGNAGNNIGDDDANDVDSGSSEDVFVAEALTGIERGLDANSVNMSASTPEVTTAASTSLAKASDENAPAPDHGAGSSAVPATGPQLEANNAADVEWNQLTEEDVARLQAEIGMENVLLQNQTKALQGATESISEEMYGETRDLLRLFGLPYLEAPMEAEAQCAFMNERGLVDAVLTEDSDAFLFGAKVVYRHLFREGADKFAEAYDVACIESELGLDREKLIKLAMLLGSDYTSGVRGVGIVNSMEILQAFPGDDGLVEFKKWAGSVTLMDKEPTEEEIEGSSAAAVRRRFCWKHRNMKRNWEVRDSFPNPNVANSYLKPDVDMSELPFTWHSIDADGLARFCWEKFGWGSEKFSEAIGPVLKQIDLFKKVGSQQAVIDDYFKPHRFAKIRSIRLQSAVMGVAGEKAGPLMALSRDTRAKRAVGTKRKHNAITKRGAFGTSRDGNLVEDGSGAVEIDSQGSGDDGESQAGNEACNV
jgi:hypothetical protein